MEQVKKYHSPATKGSMAAGHPEIEYPGELTATNPPSRRKEERPHS